MNDINTYVHNFFTFNNPVFFALILAVAIIAILIFIYVKIIYPLQKKFISENQRYLLEKAELMALFAELDPDPLLRINKDGLIIQSNEASRKLFRNIALENAHISDVLGSEFEKPSSIKNNWIQFINDRFYNITARKQEQLGFINIYLHDITDLKEYENQLELYKSNLIALSNSLDKQNEELKKRLAADLHDDIGQRMIVTKLKLSQPDKYSLEEIKNEIEDVSKRIRDISHELSPINLNNLGLIFTVGRIIERISDTSGMEGYIKLENDEDEFENNLTDDIKECLLHCVQEGINNIVKHSKASTFVVSLAMNNSSVLLEISDDGIGISDRFDNIHLSGKSGYGLFRLRERVRNLKGSFNISSSESYTTILKIKLPGKSENGNDKTVSS